MVKIQIYRESPIAWLSRHPELWAEDVMTDEEAIKRQMAAAHAMQSGVAMEMQHRPQPTEPKHLRVGINAAMVDHSALAKLLIDKGVITKSEYLVALAEGMEAEQARYEEYLTGLIGAKITLG